MENKVEKTEQYIREIESKALMELNAVKFGEDNYILPANIVNTNLIESEDYKNSDFYKNEELKKIIYKLDVAEGDYISVSCSDVTEDEKLVIDIINTSDLDNVHKIALDCEFEYDEREMLITMIADAHKEHKDVHVSFYVGCDFEALEELVCSEE